MKGKSARPDKIFFYQPDQISWNHVDFLLHAFANSVHCSRNVVDFLKRNIAGCFFFAFMVFNFARTPTALFTSNWQELFTLLGALTCWLKHSLREVFKVSKGHKVQRISWWQICWTPSQKKTFLGPSRIILGLLKHVLHLVPSPIYFECSLRDRPLLSDFGLFFAKGNWYNRTKNLDFEMRPRFTHQ